MVRHPHYGHRCQQRIAARCVFSVSSKSTSQVSSPTALLLPFSSVSVRAVSARRMISCVILCCSCFRKPTSLFPSKKTTVQSESICCASGLQELCRASASARRRLHQRRDRSGARPPPTSRLSRPRPRWRPRRKAMTLAGETPCGLPLERWLLWVRSL